MNKELVELLLKELICNDECSSQSIESNNNTPFVIGKSYLIRTVTHIDLGEVVDVVGNFVILQHASWIADTGRYHDCLSEAKLNEVEPYPNTCFVNLGSVCDAAPWNHALPRDQK